MPHSNQFTSLSEVIVIMVKANAISRACENLGTTPSKGKKVKSPKESAVFDQIFHTGYNASFDDFETLVKLTNLASSSESRF